MKDSTSPPVHARGTAPAETLDHYLRLTSGVNPGQDALARLASSCETARLALEASEQSTLFDSEPQALESVLSELAPERSS